MSGSGRAYGQQVKAVASGEAAVPAAQGDTGIIHIIHGPSGSFQNWVSSVQDKLGKDPTVRTSHKKGTSYTTWNPDIQIFRVVFPRALVS